MESVKRIIIDITYEGEPCAWGIKVETVERTVSVDYEVKYSDRMKADIYYKSLPASDPIHNLEMFLSGLERNKNDKADNEDTELKALRHFKDTSVGLWCIDRDPNEVSMEWIRKHAFRLEFSESDKPL